MLNNLKHLIGIENMGSVEDIKWAMKIQNQTRNLNLTDIQSEAVSYDWKTARNMIVHTREDLVLLICLNSMIAGRLSNISFYLRFILILLGVLVFYQVYA